MKMHDTVVLKGFKAPLGIIRAISPKAICLGFVGKSRNGDTWIPKKLLKIEGQKDVVRNYRNIQEFIVNLPIWFANKELKHIIKE